MKILVAIPTYDGKLPIQVVKSLLEEQHIAHECGDELLTKFLPSCSHPAMGRNQLADDFLKSNADRLVFLDSDVTFKPGSIVKIARYREDFVGGAYRYKMDKEMYPVGWLEEKKFLQANDSGLLEVKTLPGGFLSLSKEVFWKLKEAHPERGYEHFDREAHTFFQMPFIDGALYGEDSFFCKEWRELNESVWLDPELELTHWDHTKPYEGHVGNWLRRRNNV